MNLSLIKEHHERAGQSEAFWRSAHLGAETDAERNDYGWLWMHFKEARLRLGALLGLCPECGQRDEGQTGEYPCPRCGLPLTHDDPVGRAA